MFVTRLMSGIVLLAVMLGTIITGGNLLLFFVAAISLIGQYELYRAVKMEKTAIAFLGYCASIGYEALLYFHLTDYVMIYSVLFLIAVLAVYVAMYPKFITEQVALIIFGYFYVLLFC